MSTQITEEKAQANNKIFRRYVAKSGTVLPDCPARSVPSRDAHGLRATVRDVMTGLSKRSDREGRELSDEEMIVFSEAANFIAGLSTAIDLDQFTRTVSGDAGRHRRW